MICPEIAKIGMLNASGGFVKAESNGDRPTTVLALDEAYEKRRHRLAAKRKC